MSLSGRNVIGFNMHKKTIWCKCGDSTTNEDGVCDVCKYFDEQSKGEMM